MLAVAVALVVTMICTGQRGSDIRSGVTVSGRRRRKPTEWPLKSLRLSPTTLKRFDG